MMLVFKARSGERRISDITDRSEVPLQKIYILAIPLFRTMTTNATDKLDDRAHGRRLNDGPIIIMVATDFRDRACED